MIEFLDAAIQEEYASPHAGTVLLDTLELQHPAFVNASGFLEYPRVVIDEDDWWLKLEADAVDYPNQLVLFQACAFEWTPPSHEEGALGEAKVAVDNVSRILRPYLDKATAEPAPIKCIYRQYRASDPNTVVARYRGLELHSVTMTGSRVEGTLKFRDLTSRAFPRKYFTIQDFPALGNLYL